MSPNNPSESSHKKSTLICPSCKKELWDDTSLEDYDAVCFICRFTAPINFWRRMQEAIFIDVD